ncbi:MAG: valine--tRNA ligase, partial [Vulcanimicrobiota bacterium]
VDKDKESFCIAIPPPNITGSLHMGHALNNTIQDILIRLKRMQGFSSLWIPGTDHAGIATQRVVEKQLLKEGKHRWELGREKFLERVWAWKDDYKERIINQLKRMGCSCDWSRERFTLDEGCSRAVREAFVTLYDKGYIYRGNRIVNWCPSCSTALSDLEVEHEKEMGKLFHLYYPGEDGSEGVTIATTRPETILADVAVAVNPKDDRYKDLIGKTVILPLVNRKLPVIADYHVDIEFGTGALKITPAHDANDYAVGERHNLESIEVIDFEGKMNGRAGKYAGMDRFECRKAIVKDLKEAGYLKQVEDYEMAPGTCYRCHNIIEPHLSEQWFLNVDELAKPAIEKIKDGTTRFIPDRFASTYLNWMENLRDWCISRQLWWGHRIPIWHCEKCSFEKAYRENPEKCPNCGALEFVQEDFVLDTWFSSGLWPFSTMGWPDDTPELAYFYPTSVLSTARDIINLWVARMMMFGLEFMNEVPFSDVFIHATVLTSEGKRMSKSLGTGIDPLDLFEKFGTDATRFGLTLMIEQGQDIKFTEDKMEMSRNFLNKIWNATRYIMGFLEETHLDRNPDDFDFKLWDRWILSRLNTITEEITRSYESYNFDMAAKTLYHFFWDNFCDWYVEITKPILYGDNNKDRERTFWVLETVMDSFLRLAHPVIPFFTEEIWDRMPHVEKMKKEKGEKGSLLIISDWPEVDKSFVNKEADSEFELIMEVIKSLRNMRTEANLMPKQTARFIIETTEEKEREILETGRDVIELLSVAEKLDIELKAGKKYAKSLSARFGGIDMYMPLEGLVDIEKEIERLKKEKEKISKYLNSLQKKCSNPNFLKKAAPEVVEKEQSKLEETREKMSRIEARLESLV